jgi:hypothetical protein
LTLDFPYELLSLPFYNESNAKEFKEGVARVAIASCEKKLA